MTKEERERLGPIERDESYDRTYIPLPGGFEVQTKGKGSTFRIVDAANKFRLPVCEQPYLFDILERMARASHDTIAQLQSRLEAAERLVYEWTTCASRANDMRAAVYAACISDLKIALDLNGSPPAAETGATMRGGGE